MKHLSWPFYAPEAAKKKINDDFTHLLWSMWHFGFLPFQIHLRLGTNKHLHHILYENELLAKRKEIHLEIKLDETETEKNSRFVNEMSS